MESIKSLLERVLGLVKIYYLELIALSAVLLHLAPYFIFGQNSVIGIHDTFDSNFVWYKVLADSGMLFADSSAIVPGIMDGLPRISFGSEFNALIWLFFLFEPFAVYVINMTVMHLVGFFGMYLLLKTHVLQDEKYRIIILGVAVCFAILPLWPPAGLSVSSLPLVLYAFLNIRAKKGTKFDLLILILIPFYSSLVYTYLFFLSLIGVMWIWDVIRTRTPEFKLIGATALMAIEFLLIEYRLVADLLLGGNFVSHRVEFAISDLNLQDSLSLALENLIQGHYHVTTLHGLVILFAAGFALVVLIFARFEKLKKPLLVIGLVSLLGISAVLLIFGFDQTIALLFSLASSIFLGLLYPLSIIGVVGLVGILVLLVIYLYRTSERFKTIIQESCRPLGLMFILLGICALFSLWFGIWSSEYLLPLRQEFSLLRTIQFSRYFWLHPLFWYLLFAVSLGLISKGIDVKFKDFEMGKVIALGLILLQFTVLIPYSWEAVSMNVVRQDDVTYNEFFASDVFLQIRDDIGLPQEDYRIINIGYHPSIAQFNGFHTLDGYFNNYPLEYKHRFRNIINYELAKDTRLSTYFDDWGSRCYVLTDDLGTNYYCTKDKNLEITNLQLNTTALYEMNCAYVFSAVNITNSMDSNLQLNGVYETPNSIWRIFLYEVV